MLYEREYAGLLPRVFDKLLQFDGRAVIADPGRVSTPAFLYACKGAGFKVVEMKSLPWESGAIKQKIDIYTIAHRDHIARYFGPLPPSRGVHRGPSTSVALQSMQFAGLTTSRSPSRS